MENLSKELGHWSPKKGAMQLSNSAAEWTSLPIKMREGLEESGEKRSFER